MKYTIEYSKAKGKHHWLYSKSKASAKDVMQILKRTDNVSYVALYDADNNIVEEWNRP